MRGQGGFFDVDERLKELSAKGDDLERLSDAGKTITQCKRHIMADTDGRVLATPVQGADLQDRDAGKGVLKRSRPRYPFVQRAYANGIFAGRLVDWAKDKTHIVL